MRKSAFAVTLLTVLLCTGCGFNQPIMTDLGIPSSESYGDFFLNARNPWDMTVADGKLYIGGGDFDTNTGPADIWCYDIESEEWYNSGTVEDESVSRFLNICGNVTVPGTDPRFDPDCGNYYSLTDGMWVTVSDVPGAVHMFDIAEYCGNVFYAIGTGNNAESPVKMFSGGVYSDVGLYREGISLLNDDGVRYLRAYDLCVTESGFYCICIASSSETPYMSFFDIFKYDGNAFQFCKSIEDSGIEFDTEQRWQRFIGEKVVMNGCCYFTTGKLYKTKDFSEYKQLNVPDGGAVTDLLIETGKSGEDDLYILSTVKNSDGTYQNTIWKYVDEETYTRVYSFSYSFSALSFAKYKNRFYVGIGANGADNEKIGTIIEIKL